MSLDNRGKKRNDELWNEHFSSLKRFVDEYHKYPNTFEVYENFQLGKWFIKQFVLINELLMYEDRQKEFMNYINHNKIKRKTYRIKKT